MYRAGVVIVVFDPILKVGLIGERSDSPGSWQFPQGGIESGQTPIQAAKTELFEEMGISLEFVDSCGPFSYDYPSFVCRPQKGQNQFWFLAHASASIVPSLNYEFRDFAWLPISDILYNCVDFKKQVYFLALSKFKLL